MEDGQRIFALHAEVCRTLGHPVRLQIIYLLGEAERTPGELSSLLGVTPANLSQHLAVLRKAGLVAAEREGLKLRYRLASRAIGQACGLMRQVLFERLRQEARLLILEQVETQEERVP